MTIEGLVVEEALAHIQVHHCVKHMEPYALHILKTSQNPTVRQMRHWMRYKALEGVLTAQREQCVLNAQLAKEPIDRRASWRRRASVHPYYVGEMAHRHNANWNDNDFVNSVKEAQPRMFPERQEA